MFPRPCNLFSSSTSMLSRPCNILRIAVISWQMRVISGDAVRRTKLKLRWATWVFLPLDFRARCLLDWVVLVGNRDLRVRLRRRR